MNSERTTDGLGVSQSIEWYSEGQARTAEIGGVEITVRFVSRKGRRARIAIIAPPGATFCAPCEDATPAPRNQIESNQQNPSFNENSR